MLRPKRRNSWTKSRWQREHVMDDFVPNHTWKATKEYLNQRGAKIRVFRACFRAPFLPPFFPHFPPSFPFRPCDSPTTSPLCTSPCTPLFLAPGKVRFRYPSDVPFFSKSLHSNFKTIKSCNCNRRELLKIPERSSFL